jgi:type II secretory pathway predicted ATPase ExeA
MLLQYFGFKEEPFGVNPDPRCLYLSRTHQQALETLDLGFSSDRGFTAMIAPPGMGKTTLLFRFLEDIRDSARVVFLFDLDPQCEPREFVAYILRDLGIVPAHGSAEMHDQLSNAVIKENRAGRKFVVVIDEAQNLSDAVLERVRLLTNFETSRGKMIQIVLSGQPQLSEKLLHASLIQLRQRISTVCHIESLTAEETVGYIDYRVKMAGYLGQPLFTAGAVSLIAEASHGTPRTINNLCFNALALCCKMKLRQVDAAMVAKVIASLQLVPQPSAPIAAVEMPVAAAPERPRESKSYIGLRLIPSTYETAAPANAVAAKASDESLDQPAEPKFWQRTKLRLLHLLPATTGSVMLWVPSAAIILVASFLGVLRLTEIWAPPAHSTGVDQSTVLAAPPSAPAPDTDEPAATESNSPSDAGSRADNPVSAPAAAPKPMQASASIPKPSPAAPLTVSTSRPHHADASSPKPAAAVIHPNASTANEPSASKVSSASNPPVSSASIPASSAAAQPAVTQAAQPSSAGPTTNPVAAPSPTPATPKVTPAKQVRAALTANAPVAAQPSASPSVRPALPQP